MASRPPPSFFKVLLHPSHSQLPLPTDFVSKHLGNKIPKDPIIRTSNGGYIWKLKIKKSGKNYYFTNGWSNVVKEIELGFGDLLLFRLIDKSTFKLLIYSPTGCQKILPPKIKVEQDIDSVSIVDDGVCNVDDDVTDDDGIDDDDIDDDGDQEEEDFEDEKDDDDDDDVDDDDGYDDDDEDVDEEDVDVDDDDGVHIDGDDGDPFFMSTISKAHKSTLRLPTEFVGLADLDAEKTIILKNFDGQEWPMRLLSEKLNESERYYLSAGWAEFRRNNELLEGDECVFKYITSEDKLCLAKVTKKKRPTRQSQQSSEIWATEGVKRKWGGPPHEHGGNVDVESGSDDDINGEDDDADDNDGDDDIDDDADGIDGEDAAADDIDGEDDDPSFISTLSKTHKHILRLPAEFVELAGIEAGKTILMKDLDNKEWPMGLRMEKMNKSERYYISTGWSDFHRSNDLSEGDECVFKFIRSEGKLRLAEVTNNKRQSQPSEKILATEDDDNDCEDDDDDIDGGDIDGDDGDPSFTLIISKKCHFMRLPEKFAGLPGLEDGKTITVKNLDGEELQVGLRLDKSYKKMKKYILSTKWADFQRINNLKEGDECVFKFIRNEGKLCLVKVTKNKRGRPPRKQGDEVYVESENDSMEVMERQCGDDDEHDAEDDDIDAEDEDGGSDINGDDGDPFFTMVICKTPTMRLPEEFAGLPGIEDGKTMTVKNLDGEEQQLGLRLEKRYKRSESYLLSAGWKRFVISNKLLYGDECVFKFIRSEGKLCLAKVTKKKGLAKWPQPSNKIPATEVVKRKSGWLTRKQGDGVDVENEDDCVGAVKGSYGDDDNGNDEDEGDNDGGGDIDGDVGDPFVTFTIPKGRVWWLPEEFMGLPGIEDGKSIMVKNLEGKEQSLGLLLDRYRKTGKYFVSAGWVPFLRRNNLSEGDECVIKFIRNEGKFCLTKVTKNKRPKRKRQSAGGIPVAKVRMRRQPESPVGKLCLTKFAKNKRPARKRQSAEGIPEAKVVKRMRRQPQSPVGILVTEAVGRKRGRLLRNGADVEVVKRPRGRRSKQ